MVSLYFLLYIFNVTIM